MNRGLNSVLNRRTLLLAGLVLPGAALARQEQGAPGEPSLFSREKMNNGKKPTDANVLEKINEGGNGMPAYKEMLSDDEKDDLMAYLKTL